MKMLAMMLASAAPLLLAAPAGAQTVPKPAANIVAKHYTSHDTTIGDLLADPAAKAVIDKHLPGLSDNPQISMASGMTLRAIQPMAGDKMTPEALDAVDAELAKISGK